MMIALLLQATNPAAEVGEINSQILDLVKLLLVLAGVVLLAVVTIRYLLPKMTGMGGGTSTGPIRMVARFPLEPRKNLYIVKAGGRFLLLGTSEGEVHYLTSLQQEDVEPYLEAPEPPNARADFQKLIRGWKK